MGYPESAWERAMTVQEVVLKALSGEIHWFRAASIGRGARAAWAPYRPGLAPAVSENVWWSRRARHRPVSVKGRTTRLARCLTKPPNLGSGI